MEEKVSYFDPNDTLKGDNINDVFNFSGVNSPDLFKDPEDYSIAVDLQVITKDRSKYGVSDGNETKIYSLIGPGKTVGYLAGSELGIGKTKVLTDFFSNIGDTNNKPEVIDEALCVSSIDIEFSSWYAASVIINFTDIRGAALMQPSEYAADTNGLNGETQNESLFKSFFNFPFPIFLLKVKGFYGDVVSYPLHCTDFKAQFNANNGNFDVTVHFIGYTYAMLNDVQMSYLVSAPYYEGLGRDYWNENAQIDKRFCSAEGLPLPTIAELMKSVKDAEFSTAKLSTTDLTKSEKILTDLETLNTSIVNVLNLIDDTTTKVGTYKRTYKTDITDEKYEQYLSKNDSLKKLISDFIILEPTSKTSLSVITDLINTKSTTNTLDFSSFGDYYTNKKVVATQNRNNEQDKYASKQLGTIEKALKMKPSIFNYIKVLMAHMETMYYIIDKISEKIPTTRTFGSNTGLKKEDTDILKDKIITPFPWVSKEDPTNNNVKTDEWIGNCVNNESEFPEIELVNKFYAARTTIDKKLKELESYPGNEINGNPITSKTSDCVVENLTVDKVWYPINAFDNPLSCIGGMKSTPYSIALSLDKGLVEKGLKDLLVYRIYDYILKTGSNNDTTDEYFAISERLNIIDDINSKPEYVSLVKKILTEIGGKSLKPNTGLQLLSKNFKESRFKIIDGIDNYNAISKYYKSIEKKIIDSGVLKVSNAIFYNETFKLYDPSGKFLAPSYYSKINYELQPILNKLTNLKVKYNYKEEENPNSLFYTEENKWYNYELDLTKTGNKIYGGIKDHILNNNKLSNIYQTTVLDNSIAFNENLKGINKRNLLSYPMVGGEIQTDKNKYIFSLFGHPLYYQQNKSKKNSNYLKAFLFLQSIDIDVKKLEETLFQKKYDKPEEIDRLSSITTLPKSSVLLLGSMLWRSENENIIPYRDSLIPDTLSYFKKDNKFTIYQVHNKSISSSDFYDTSKLFVKKTEFNNIKNENVDNYYCILNKNERKFFIDYFVKWVNTRNGFGWSDISDEYEIRDNKRHFFKDGFSFEDTYSETINDFSKKVDIFLFEKTYIRVNYIKYFTTESYLPSHMLLLNRDGTNGMYSIINQLMEQSVIFDSGKNNKQIDFLNRLNNVTNKIISGLKPNDSTPKTSQTPVIKNTDNSQVEPNQTEDTKLATYTYLKTLYDKWVNGFKSGEEYKWIKKYEPTNPDKKESAENLNRDINKVGLPEFEAGRDRFVIKNFRFIDRAHNDIGDKMILNLKTILTALDSGNVQKTLFSSITDVLQNQQMLFLPMPSYQSFDSDSDLAKIFKPIPFIESSIDVETNGMDSALYLCIYAGRPSTKLNTNGEFTGDSFDFNTLNVPNDFLNKKGSSVPAIAVNYGQQNQSYFKNISVNMSNPNITDASVNILKSINERANQKSTLEPIGQDLFSLYSNYSYTCDVEMLGCPQIQPMMYFQLNNIPLFNGAYMIYKIKHSIKPGTMITNFSGMRMAKTYPKLIKDQAISFSIIGATGNAIDFGTVPTEGVTGDKFKDVWTDPNAKKPFNTGDHFNIVDYFPKGKYLDSGKITNQIYNRVSYLSKVIEFIYSSWNNSANATAVGDLVITSGYRNLPTKKDDVSAHLIGLAVDFQIKGKESNSGYADILFKFVQQLMNDGLKIDQVVLEKKTGYLVHIGIGHQEKGLPIVKNDRYESRGMKLEQEADGNGNYVTKKGTLDYIPSAKWPEVDSVSSTPLNTDLTGTRKENQIAVKNWLRNNGYTQQQTAGIMGNIWQESSFNLNKPNYGGISTGLIHWSKGGGYGSSVQDILNKIGDTVEEQLTFLTDGRTTNFKIHNAHVKGYVAGDTFLSKTSNKTITPEECTLIFCQLVEQAGTPEINKRKGYALDMYLKFSDSSHYLYWLS